MRTILYTGKGGVGKTSVAAATAVLAADMGYRTVVVSTDIAHSLADSFDVPLGPEPVAVTSNLWGQEIDVLKEMDDHWSTVKEWLSALMRWQGADDVVADEVAILPGMEELVGLLYITRYAEGSDYDLLIVDCAPTGETLRLLSFPEVARWYMQKLFPLERRVAAAVGPIARRLLGVPVPEVGVFDTIEELFHQLERMRDILTDENSSSVRLVVNPEKMVIKETQRTFTYMNLYGYCTDLVICNRVFPDEVKGDFFDAWKESQARYLELIDQSFSPVPILQAPLMKREVVGLDALRELAHTIFDSQDPTKMFYRGQTQKVSKEGADYILKLAVPFADLKDLAVMKNGGELVVQVGHHRRNILLPRSLAGLEVKEAKKDGDMLKLVFHDPNAKLRSKRGKGGR